MGAVRVVNVVKPAAVRVPREDCGVWVFLKHSTSTLGCYLSCSLGVSAGWVVNSAKNHRLRIPMKGKRGEALGSISQCQGCQ